MIKFTLAVLMMVLSTLAWSADVDLSTLERVEGDAFRVELDRLVGDPSVISALRASQEKGNTRHELLKAVILARVDHQPIFNDFQAILDLAQPGSPVWNAEWSSDPQRARRVLLERFMREWAKSAPSPQSFIEWYTKPGVIEPLGREAPISSQRMWPAFSFGIASPEKQMRVLVCPVLRAWCKESDFSELSLEAMLWVCERTNYDDMEPLYYNVMVNQAMKSTLPDADKARFVTRQLSGLEAGEKLVKADNKPGIFFRLESAEKFGNASHAPVLRRLADMPVWSAYHDRMLEVAKVLEGRQEPIKAP